MVQQRIFERLLKYLYKHRSQRFFYTLVVVIAALSCLWFLPLRGLEGRYYDNPEWRGEPILSLRDRKIDVNTIKKRHDVLPEKDFSITWSGWIRIDRAGDYAFATVSDDGSSLVVDGVQVVDNGGFHGAKKAAGTMFLTQGMHTLQISYFQGAGDYALRVFWTEPDKAERALPSHHLYRHPFPVRGLGFLTRHLTIIYGTLLGFLVLLLLKRVIMNNRGNMFPLLKRLGLNIALSCFTIVIVCICVEVGMRVILHLREKQKDLAILLQESEQADLPENSEVYSLKGMLQASSHDGIVFELKPNLRGQFQGQSLITNSRGLRDIDYSFQKPENTIRIVGIGDSLLFGWGVEAEDTSLKVLERNLNQKSSVSGVRYEVINFAVPGYNTAIEAEVFAQKCVRYAPDAVILRFFVNDYDLPLFMKRPQNYASLRKFYLFDFLYSRYKLLWKEQQQIQQIVLLAGGRNATNMDESYRLDESPSIPDEYRYMVGERGMITAIEKLAALTASYQIPLIVAFLPMWPDITDYSALWDRQAALLEKLSAQHNFFYVDLYPYYLAYREQHPQEKSPDMFQVIPWADIHPNAVAHALEAEAFYDILHEKTTVLAVTQEE